MTTTAINREELTAAIFALNSMSRDQGIIMSKDGHIKTGNEGDEETLCMLIPAPILARQLTADGLSSYTGKELKAWAEAYDTAEIEARLAQI